MHKMVYLRVAELDIVVVGDGMREGGLMCFELCGSRLMGETEGDDPGVRGYRCHDERLGEL